MPRRDFRVNGTLGPTGGSGETVTVDRGSARADTPFATPEASDVWPMGHSTIACPADRLPAKGGAPPLSGGTKSGFLLPLTTGAIDGEASGT